MCDVICSYVMTWNWCNMIMLSDAMRCVVMVYCLFDKLNNSVNCVNYFICMNIVIVMICVKYTAPFWCGIFVLAEPRLTAYFPVVGNYKGRNTRLFKWWIDRTCQASVLGGVGIGGNHYAIIVPLGSNGF